MIDTVRLLSDYIIWLGIILVMISMVLAILSLFGHRSFAERILSINILGTKTVILVLLFSYESGELAWMIDLSVIYVLINFVAILSLLKFAGGDQ